MKLLHIADLHIGKRLNEYSLLEDQQYILEQIIQTVRREKPDGVLVAGDVYDKSLPSAEAVELLDNFLTRLAAEDTSIFLISGNHDSPERIHFGSRFFQRNRLYIAGVFGGTPEKISLSDDFGAVHIYLLPFIKPATANPFLDNPAENYEEAIRAVLSKTNVDTSQRNVLLAHQFVAGSGIQPERCESETLTVGGLDQISASVFDAFDYVALGHLHSAQSISRDTVRYAGSPLKYSFSEARKPKSVVLVELRDKGEITMRQIPLNPLRDMREIKGPLSELLRAGQENPDCATDYIYATLTDEEDIYGALVQLRQVYPHLMVMDYDNRRSRAAASELPESVGEYHKSPTDLFGAFYLLQNNSELTAEQAHYMEEIFQQAGGREL